MSPKLRLPLLLLGALALVAAAKGGGQTSDDDANAVNTLSTVSRGVQAGDCVACHEEYAEPWALGPHAAPGAHALAAAGGDAASCTICHGDGTQHIEEGGGEGTIFSFGESALASESNATCQGCHLATHPRFEASHHARAGLACTDCHSVHERVTGDDNHEARLRTLLEGPRTSDGCADCHMEVFDEFEGTERHRLQEGVLECTSCHDPHAPTSRWLLGGFKQEACADCHVDKTGPFVFEHGSVRGESCTACHTPHASPNRHMLLFQNVAELCYTCHVMVPGFHTNFTNETQCTNCHSTIHGSHFDPHFLR